MNDDFLMERLRRVIRLQQWLGLMWKLAACWVLAAIGGAIVIWAERATGWSSPVLLPLIAGIAATAVTAVVMVHAAGVPDFRWAARKIEAAHPELQGVLLTAVQQVIEPGGAPGFLQHRVLEEATTRSLESDWRRVVPAWRIAVAGALQLAALAVFLTVIANIRLTRVVGHDTSAGWVGADGLSITPGDTSIERGDSLVVLARFGRTLPANVNLVVRENGGAHTVPLVKSLADPVFGGSVPEVANDFTYRVDYGGRSTREFKVNVFEHPRLVRADADLTFPSYTKLPPKHIDDTRRVSAVEGTKLGFTLQLNKPVAAAKLVARDKAKTEIALRVEPGKPMAALPAIAFAASQTYDLKLIDADGRSNKSAAPFIIEVQPNRPPELRLASPRGDIRPSALEEITFDGTVFDDFGALSYGVTYEVAGGPAKTIELGRDVSAKEKRAFHYTLKLEDLGVKPDDLVSWYVWADDSGPDGKVRRTKGDLFFAEVRPFDEIFRESQGMQSDDNQQPSAGGQGNPVRKLTDLQKQIINATWRLQRDGATPKYADDAAVVADSQEQALAQAGESKDKTQSVREQAMWTAATSEMEKALEKLRAAAKTPAPLAEALPAEQAAYQALLKLQARDTQVARGRNRRGGQGGQGGAMNQRQIDQLDLTQAENRYETQRQAPAPQTAQRQEQLQVMNRLQELARRQQDLNDRLKELQTALQESKTEQEREDVKRRLKRLEEEQQQMLADTDEVRQRMERPENQSSMAPEHQQLDQTREDLQKAAEAAAAGSVAQALAAGTRAQRSLQQLRDDLRKENSSQFADDLREMRNEARDLSRQQDELSQTLDRIGGTQQRKTLGGSDEQPKLQDQLTQQKEKMNQLVDRAKQISEQAENSEPLLSRQLYDSVRKLNSDDAETLKQAKQELISSGQMSRDLLERIDQAAEKDDAGKALELTRDLLREGNLSSARQAGQRARGEMNELRRGVERAAESVLGDDAEQLKLAQAELDSLAEQLRQEIAQGQGRAAGTAASPENRSAVSSPPDQKQPASPGGSVAANEQTNSPRTSGQSSGNRQNGGGRGGLDLTRVFDNRGNSTIGVATDGYLGGAWTGGPITSANFGPWTERLRDVETLLDSPELRAAVAAARERARLLRRDFAVKHEKPDWAVVQLQILKPLVEVRGRVAEELARRDPRDQLAPIDRDPVPSRFADSVRRYYEELGKDKPDAK